MEPLIKTLSCKVFWFFTKGANSLWLHGSNLSVRIKQSNEWPWSKRSWHAPANVGPKFRSSLKSVAIWCMTNKKKKPKTIVRQFDQQKLWVCRDNPQVSRRNCDGPLRRLPLALDPYSSWTPPHPLGVAEDAKTWKSWQVVWPCICDRISCTPMTRMFSSSKERRRASSRAVMPLPCSALFW